MHRLIASSYLQIINHFHRLEPLASSRVKWKHDETGWASKVWLPTILHAQVFLVLKKQQTKPSLCPSLPLPSALSLSPPLLSRLLKESPVLMDSISFSLSLSFSIITSTDPHTPPSPDSTPGFSVSPWSPFDTTIYPAL